MIQGPEPSRREVAHGHARGPGRLHQDPARGAGDRPQPLAPGHPAAGDAASPATRWCWRPGTPSTARWARTPPWRRWPAPNLDVVHPLTGPVYVDGAEPGDLLEVEILEVEPDRYGYTVQVPGFGFLRDEFPDPFMVRWRIARRLGDLGRPARACASPARRSWAPSAWPPTGPCWSGPPPASRPPSTGAGSCSRPTPATPSRPTRRSPPRPCGPSRPASTAGNVDIKQLGTPAPGCYIPVYADGGLFSAGDAHFAQGDCETCGTAIEMTLDPARPLRRPQGRGPPHRGIRDLQFARDGLLPAARVRRPAPVLRHHRPCRSTRDGESRPEDLTLAARNALLNMIDHLGRRRLDPPAGLRHLQRGRRPQDQPARRRARASWSRRSCPRTSSPEVRRPR